MRNLIQFASGFAAFGCKFNYDSYSGELEIIATPPKQLKIVEKALKDIELYEDTANHLDGLAVLIFADKINDENNPLNADFRSGMLSSNLGLCDHSGKFIRNVIHSIKVQRSWHSSEEPNTCTYFGDLCTNRAADNEGKRGRKTNRAPNEFHVKNTRGIAKEQLVTENLSALYAAIPEDNLTQGMQRVSYVSMEQQILKMTPDEARKWIEKIKETVGV